MSQLSYLPNVLALAETNAEPITTPGWGVEQLEVGVKVGAKVMEQWTKRAGPVLVQRATGELTLSCASITPLTPPRALTSPS